MQLLDSPATTDSVKYKVQVAPSDTSGNVFVNGRPVSCQSHNNTVHKLPPTPSGAHAAAISSGSPNVKVNNLGIGRVGDGISGCTTVAVRSQNVFANGQPS